MPTTYEKVTEYRKKEGTLIPVYPATSTDNVLDTDGETLLSSKLSAMQSDIDGKSPIVHSHNASDINAGTLAAARIPNLDASKITTGTISIDRLPAGALERLVVVADQAARFALTSSQIQLGDTVKQADTGVMYYVKDTSKLSSADGYEEYTAGAATSVPWSGVTGKPSAFTPSSHSHNSSEVTAMTGYSKPSATSAVAASDSLNAAVGKLEKALDGKAATSHGTHVTYSSETPKAAGTASAGSASTVSRGDHVHPAQTSVTGSAGSATKDGSGNVITATYVTAVGSTPSGNTLQVTKNGTASNVSLPQWAGFGTALPASADIAAMPEGACFILFES